MCQIRSAHEDWLRNRPLVTSAAPMSPRRRAIQSAELRSPGDVVRRSNEARCSTSRRKRVATLSTDEEGIVTVWR
jgi:hypothetical protein